MGSFEPAPILLVPRSWTLVGHLICTSVHNTGCGQFQQKNSAGMRGQELGIDFAGASGERRPAKPDQLVSCLAGAVSGGKTGVGGLREQEFSGEDHVHRICVDCERPSSAWPALGSVGYDSGVWEERVKH